MENAVKRLLAGLMIGFFVVSLCYGQGKDKLLLVKISGIDRKLSYELMSPDAFKALQTDIKAETSAFTKAVVLVKNDWAANEDTRGKRFPKASLAARKATSIGTYTDAEKAAKKLQYYEDKKFEKELEDAERAKAKYERLGKEKQAEHEDEIRAEEQLLTKAKDLLESRLAGLTGAAKEPDAD